MTRHKEEIGQALRDARQAAGLTLKDIADAIRVRPIYLQAIEAGQFELLPALPQTVGFTRAYAKYLHVDVDQPLSRLGEEVHETIERTDYSEPEIPWTMVSNKRIAWVGGGIVLGLVLAASFVMDVDTPPGEIAVASRDTASITAPAAAGNEVLPTMQVQRAKPVLADMVSRVPMDEAAAATVQPVSFVPATDDPRKAEGMAAPVNSSVPGSSSVSADEAAPPAEQEEVAALSAPAEASAPAAPESGDNISSLADPHFVTGSVYLRSKPDNGGQVVGVLNSCEPVALLGHDRTDYWREVKREDGSGGWVFRDYVSGDEPANCS